MLVSMTAVVAGVYEDRPSQEDTLRRRLLLAAEGRAERHSLFGHFTPGAG